MRVPFPTSFLHASYINKHVFVYKTMDFDQIAIQKSLFLVGPLAHFSGCKVNHCDIFHGNSEYRNLISLVNEIWKPN